MTDNPLISVIIPNLHSPIIDRVLDSIFGQDVDMPFEVIVIGMDKYDLVKNHDQVRFIQTPQPVGAAEARNIGIKAARSDWLFFIDADCIAQTRWMHTLIEEFANGWLVVGGGVKTPEEPFWLLVYNLSMFYGELATQPERMRKFMPTLNLAVHRQVIEKVGMMNEDLPRGQDIEWTARMTEAGYELLFQPKAAIEHLPERKNFKAVLSYVRKSGYYMIQVRQKFPEIFHTPCFLSKSILWWLLAPILAGYVTLKIFKQTKEVRKHWRILPYIFLQKLSWCYGAAESLQSRERPTT
jgi:glycosyltransferase involved in cell wall biosynthesis